MPLVHGQNISAQEIEHEVSRWDAVLFARLGNAIAWASTWEDTPTTPAFTERVNVADNGIDAQWIGTIALDDAGRPSLLRDGTNVFQYKKREVTEQSRAAVVTGLAQNCVAQPLMLSCKPANTSARMYSLRTLILPLSSTRGSARRLLRASPMDTSTSLLSVLLISLRCSISCRTCDRRSLLQAPSERGAKAGMRMNEPLSSPTPR
jgi:hypothetical protein